MGKSIVKPECLNCWKVLDCKRATPGAGFCAEFQEKEPKRDPADNPAEKWSRGDEME